MYFVLVTN